MADDVTVPPAAASEASVAPGVLRAREALKDVPHEPGAAKPDPILVADSVVRRFGGLTAVSVDHIEIQRGAITALIGPNGAGKTTFFNLLTGFDRPDEGEWKFNGSPLAGVPAHKVAKKGMVRTFQLTKALSRLSVIDNMRLGGTGQKGESFWRSLVPGLWKKQEQEITERADDLLKRFKLDAKRADFAGSLSGGQRKLLEMARALMVQPDMVMLDEPMAGVNPALTQSLLGHVKSLREDGMTVLFVEHDMDMVRDISDWVIVMGQGKVIAEGTPDTVMADPRVIDAYLGSHHDGTEHDSAEVAAEVPGASSVDEPAAASSPAASASPAAAPATEKAVSDKPASDKPEGGKADE
ncbi:putative ABC transporter ATP-binding protein [Actinoplanes missouriensis 431]|uniref:Putative ABC transporter ATP-binding protein n=1 Tax=Actinoplanes missouriensis (strain ATCC 14538 / DSM 43046 / CBS 188.64 / JCM 3121 / NBRC 102363 / NCIMB 12654 / NRRL B-3342 / UNCC 431) TaxID=512565 RepID=I0H1B2_ACTM4|nr:ABC transporter ATP-binding protein [Actinoplanes missouriensis]BAL86799.1 putative ABC transporter ATP-binding protein [Actinoplanes missouriensis 431]